MRIGIDARLYSESGIGRYIRNLITHLQRLDTSNEYFILLGKKEYQELEFTGNFRKVLADFRWYSLKEQIKLPFILNDLNLDLVHFPHFNIPVIYNGKYIVTIHDLIHQKFSMQRATTHGPLVYFIKQSAYRFIFWLSLIKSKKIITVSNYVKNDLVNSWQVESNKIEVTPEAVEENILDIAKKIKQSEIKDTLEHYKVRQPFIFYIGNAHPHKNIEGLIKTFLNLRKKYQYLQLVLGGHDHYFWQRIKKEYQYQDIVYVGQITDREMVAFYKGAKVYVFPSFEEGFGIPLLEAFSCNTPVASSNKASLTEVGGEAALYFDPNNLEDMEQKIESLLNQEKLRKELITKGEKRYKQFSWDKMAKQTLQLYTKIA